MTKNKSRPLALLAAGMLWAGLVKGQESVNASGGDAIGSGGALAFSVGQVFYTNKTGSNGSVELGVQHAYEIFTLGIKETAMNISFTTFPNPITEILTLQIREYNDEKLSYQLFDMEGKQLSNGQITAQQTQINMSSLPTASYFINVVNQKKQKSSII
jgi:hypothetical protein